MEPGFSQEWVAGALGALVQVAKGDSAGSYRSLDAMPVRRIIHFLGANYQILV
jgi:hypothetical protein